NQTNIVILDACRDNPLVTRSTRPTDLAPIYAPRGTLIAFSTSPGQTASDGIGRNGAFTEALLRHISTPELTIEDVLKRTRNTLFSITNGKQISWEHTSLTGDFYFKINLVATLDYDKNVVADKNFNISENEQFNEILSDLRSHNWHKQNPAVEKLNPSLLQQFDNN